MRFFLTCLVGIALPILVFAETVAVFSDNTIPQIKFAAIDVKSALESKGFKVEMNELSKLKSTYSKTKSCCSKLKTNY